MAYSYEELKGKTVAELREIAKDVVGGSSQMNKDHLLPALCKALDIHDRERLKSIRRQMHHLNRQIRSHMN